MFETSYGGKHKVVDALLLHLASGKGAKDFRGDGIEASSELQPVTVNLAYDPNIKLFRGETTWDLSFMAFTSYIEILSMVTESPSMPAVVLTGSVNLNSNPKSGNSLLFNPLLLPGRPDKIHFEACLFVLEPAKFFSNVATLNL